MDGGRKVQQIKINYPAVEQALTNLRNKADAIDFPRNSGTPGQNYLQAIHTLNIINEQFRDLILRYQRILQQNEQATRNSVQQMKETDQQIAINMAKGLEIRAE